MKKLISCVLFCALLLLLFFKAEDILVPKDQNRYYILEKALEEQGEFDVHIYGSCHSYTSFVPAKLQKDHGLTSFCMGNSGEIIPTTYLRMHNYFKKDTPKVALVEIWGLFAYETYSTHENIFENYMPVNVERIPFSLEKLEVINDYETLNLMDMNSAIWHYKDRLFDKSLTKADFEYSFENTKENSTECLYTEMELRLSNGGFCERPTWIVDSRYTPYRDVSKYHDYQAVVADDEILELEADIVKYVDKIIALCQDKGVELIFYRTPYISKANELKKVNWFEQYCEEKGVVFVDLEKDVAFDLATDFQDYQHLNQSGAEKATAYLADFILNAIEKEN